MLGIGILENNCFRLKPRYLKKKMDISHFVTKQLFVCSWFSLSGVVHFPFLLYKYHVKEIS